MKREELTAAGLNEEQVNLVMKLNGDDINREKAKYADYDVIKQQLEKHAGTYRKKLLAGSRCCCYARRYHR